MERKRMTKEEAKKKIAPTKKRNLNADELRELQAIQTMVNARRFESLQVKANSALVPRGQEVAAELEALYRLLENVKNGWMAQKLLECGYEQGALTSVNLETGEIQEKETA